MLYIVVWWMSWAVTAIAAAGLLKVGTMKLMEIYWHTSIIGVDVDAENLQGSSARTRNAVLRTSDIVPPTRTKPRGYAPTRLSRIVVSLSLRGTKQLWVGADHEPLMHVLVCVPVGKSNDVYRIQHAKFVATLAKFVPRVEYVTASPESGNSRVFTRDIGFVVGPTVYGGQMVERREIEARAFGTWLDARAIRHTLLGLHIEGGDVTVDAPNVWVGHSGRTQHAAIDDLQTKVASNVATRDYVVQALPFASHFLHLDCIFSVVAPHEAIIYKPAFSYKHYRLLASHYTLIEVTQREQQTLATNVLVVAHRTLVASHQNPRVNACLRRRGFHVIELDLSVFIAARGGPRCLTLPLQRLSIK
jgi:N-dimethylarginine dimethylaminohydrolase